MKRYFKTILFDRIRTVSHAEETIKLVCTGLYVLGVLTFLELIARIAVDEFIEPDPSLFYLPGAYLLDVLFVLAAAFFLGRTKGRTLASAIVCFWLFTVFGTLFPSLFIEPNAYMGLNAPFRYFELVESIFGSLMGYGGLRGSIRYHQLMKGGT